MHFLFHRVHAIEHHFYLIADRIGFTGPLADDAALVFVKGFRCVKILLNTDI